MTKEQEIRMAIDIAFETLQSEMELLIHREPAGVETYLRRNARELFYLAIELDPKIEEFRYA